jgi:hypothetical protein
MTLEHAENQQKTIVFSAQSLALVNALFYGKESGPDDATNINRGLTETDLSRGGLSGSNA